MFINLYIHVGFGIFVNKLLFFPRERLSKKTIRTVFVTYFVYSIENSFLMKMLRPLQKSYPFFFSLGILKILSIILFIDIAFGKFIKGLMPKNIIKLFCFRFFTSSNIRKHFKRSGSKRYLNIFYYLAHFLLITKD